MKVVFVDFAWCRNREVFATASGAQTGLTSYAFDEPQIRFQDRMREYDKGTASIVTCEENDVVQGSSRTLATADALVWPFSGYYVTFHPAEPGTLHESDAPKYSFSRFFPCVVALTSTAKSVDAIGERACQNC